MMVMTIHMVISALSFEIVLTKSRCVAAVIQDATSKPYTINIRRKYWKGNKWNTRITSTSEESFLFLQITVMFSAAHSPKYNFLIDLHVNMYVPLKVLSSAIPLLSYLCLVKK